MRRHTLLPVMFTALVAAAALGLRTRSPDAPSPLRSRYWTRLQDVREQSERALSHHPHYETAQLRLLRVLARIQQLAYTEAYARSGMELAATSYEEDSEFQIAWAATVYPEMRRILELSETLLTRTRDQATYDEAVVWRSWAMWMLGDQSDLYVATARRLPASASAGLSVENNLRNGDIGTPRRSERVHGEQTLIRIVRHLAQTYNHAYAEEHTRNGLGARASAGDEEDILFRRAWATGRGQPLLKQVLRISEILADGAQCPSIRYQAAHWRYWALQELGQDPSVGEPATSVREIQRTPAPGSPGMP